MSFHRKKYDGHLSIQGYQRPPSAAPTSTSSTSSLPPSGAFELAFGGTWGRPPRCRDVANVQHWQKPLCYARNKTIHLDCQVTSGWLYIYTYTYISLKYVLHAHDVYAYHEVILNIDRSSTLKMPKPTWIMDEIKHERGNITNHGHHALLDMDLQVLTKTCIRTKICNVCYDDKVF